MLITDTDSRMYEIFTQDFYKDIQNDVYKHFDTSNYPENHQIKSLTKRKYQNYRVCWIESETVQF